MEPKNNMKENVGVTDLKFNAQNAIRIFASLSSDLKDKRIENMTMTPSEYKKQVFMTTSQREEYLTKFKYLENLQKFLTVNEKFKGFHITPKIIVFQQFLPGNVYNVTLTIRNATQVVRSVKAIFRKDPFFSLDRRGSNFSTSIAPGLAQFYTVKFCPVEKCDYEYQAEFLTDDAVLQVPIIAIGARPVLDFPDSIELAKSAVKIPSTKTILVRNIGDVSAAFILYTDNCLFDIDPPTGVINTTEYLQFTLKFLAEKSGDYEGNIFLAYELGEIVSVKIRASVTGTWIQLDRHSVRMDETFLGMSRSETLTIYNRSEYIVKFRWVKHKTSGKDCQRKEELKKLYEKIHDVEINRKTDLLHYNICEAKDHEIICQRIYSDEIVSLLRENFPYTDVSFLLEPMEGEIWPKSYTIVTVYFRATKVGESSSVAYLEATGIEERIPLKLWGVSKGPLICFNVKTIDLRNIYLSSVHICEVVVFNKGFISGTLIHEGKSANSSANVTTYPSSLTLQPDERKALSLSFSSNQKGVFVERVGFVIQESLETISLSIIGNAVCPELLLDKEALDFGIISLGFRNEQEVSLKNPSTVPVAFTITIMDDGDENSLTYEVFAAAPSKPSFPTRPREFQVFPNKGLIDPQSTLKIKLVYTANLVREGLTRLRIESHDAGLNPVILPMIFRGMIATLTITPSEINLGSCLINFPYTRVVTIENHSDLEGYFYLPPQLSAGSLAITYSTTTYEGLVKGQESKTITVTFVTRCLGLQRVCLNMLTMGQESARPFCDVTSHGKAPMISVTPKNIDFGDVNVLQEHSRKVYIRNDSPAPAHFRMTLANKNSAWSVAVSTGDLEPHGSIEVFVKLYLRNVGRCSDDLLIAVIHGRPIRVRLKANGTGCSILFEPNIFPTFDMGVHLSRRNVSIPIAVKNLSEKHYKVFGTISQDLSNRKTPKTSSTTPKFQLHPNVLDALPGKIGELHCTVQQDLCGNLAEEWYFYGQIRDEGRHELLGSSVFRVTFVEPHISFNKREFAFFFDVPSHDEGIHEKEELVIKNESGLDFSVHLAVSKPFSLANDEEKDVQELSIILPNGTTTEIHILFLPTLKKDVVRTRIYKEKLIIRCGEHPATEEIRCVGSVNFAELIIQPKEIDLHCPVGCSVQEILTLTNTSSIPIMCKFIWLDETIEIQVNRQLLEDNSEIELNEESFNSQSTLVVQKLPDANQEKCMDIIEPNSQSFFAEDAEMSQTLSVIPSTVEYVNKILNIIPQKASISPHSENFVSLVFHGLEPLQFKGTLACQTRDNIELINVSANADYIRFSLDKQIIKFGKQLLCQTYHEKICLRNDSSIQLSYVIELAEWAPKRIAWKFLPDEGTVQSNSSIDIDVTCRPILLGPFDVPFTLKLERSLLRPLRITGVGILPQVYLHLPRESAFKEHPVELGYHAIQELSSELERPNWPREDYDFDNASWKSQLETEGWLVISTTENFPRIMDIEMAVERILVTKFLEKHINILEKDCINTGKYVIPSSIIPEYIIDLGPMAIGAVTNFTCCLANYSPSIVPIKLNIPKDLTDSDIEVQLKNESTLAPGDKIFLNIICHPTRTKFVQRFTNVIHKMYLEVTHGCCLPIILRGIVTYPYVTVSTTVLHFKNVIAGECLMMGLVIKNEYSSEGMINCSWEAWLLKNRKESDENSFHFYYNRDEYSPTQSGIIHIYFRPHKPGYVEAKLCIGANMGFETTTVILKGRSVSQKLLVIEPVINFKPVIPSTEVQEIRFLVKNVSRQAIELSWRHLDSWFPRECRLAGILAHYYRVEEILLPPRQFGETIPSVFEKFYDYLAKKMMTTESWQELNDDPQIIKKETEGISNDFVSSSAIDSDQIYNLLHYYIENLHKQPNFHEDMKDPVKDLFDEVSSISKETPDNSWKREESFDKDAAIRTSQDTDIGPKYFSILSPKYMGFANISEKTGMSEVLSISSIFKSVHESSESEKNMSTAVETEKPAKARWILQANEAQEFKVQFRPTEAKRYEEIFPLTIIGGRYETYVIRVTGTADMPRLDLNPRAVFNKVVDVKLHELNEPTYFLDTETLDFGPLPVVKKDDRKTHHRKCRLNFHNVSAVDVEVNFSLIKNNLGVFKIASDGLHIPTGQCRSLDLSACARQVGELSDQLQIFITHNPNVDANIRLRCIGSKVNVHVQPKRIFFGPVLLFRKETRISTIFNDSAIPLVWRLEAEKPTESQITFEPVRGVLESSNQQNIAFRYNASRVGRINEKFVVLKVFFCEDDEEPMITEKIAVSGESYDVAVDIEHANPIDLRTIKVGVPVEACLIIRNRGPLEIQYAITVEEDGQFIGRDVTLKRDLQVVAIPGSLKPLQSTPVQVVFLAKKPMTIKNQALLKCRLIDENKNVAYVADIPLTVSLTAQYAKFRIHPYPKIDFGVVDIYSSEQALITIENQGKFPLHYIISARNSQNEEQMDAKKIERLTKSTNNALNVGEFIVRNPEGYIECLQSDTVPVEYHPQSVGPTKKYIVIHVDDCSPEDQFGREIILAGTSCVPSIKIPIPHN